MWKTLPWAVCSPLAAWILPNVGQRAQQHHACTQSWCYSNKRPLKGCGLLRRRPRLTPVMGLPLRAAQRWQRAQEPQTVHKLPSARPLVRDMAKIRQSLTFSARWHSCRNRSLAGAPPEPVPQAQGLLPDGPIAGHLHHLHVARQQQAVLQDILVQQTNASQGVHMDGGVSHGVSTAVGAAAAAAGGPARSYGSLGLPPLYSSQPHGMPQSYMGAGSPVADYPGSSAGGHSPLQGTIVTDAASQGAKPANLFDTFPWRLSRTEFEFMLAGLGQGGRDLHADRHPSHAVAALMGYNARLYARGTAPFLHALRLQQCGMLCPI